MLTLYSSVPGSRTVLGGSFESLASLAATLRAPSPRFVLAIAADTVGMPGPDLFDAAEALVRGGASYACCWGPGCERLHDAFDEADLAVNGESTTDRLVMTTWHSDEPLEDFVWFAVNAAWPAPDYTTATTSVIVASVGNPRWASTISAYLAAGAPPLPEAAPGG